MGSGLILVFYQVGAAEGDTMEMMSAREGRDESRRERTGGTTGDIRLVNAEDGYTALSARSTGSELKVLTGPSLLVCAALKRRKRRAIAVDASLHTDELESASSVRGWRLILDERRQ